VKKEAVRFLKKMPCSKVAEAEEMLNSLFPEALGDDVSARTKSEIQNRNLEKSPSCFSGIEFHLKSCENRRARRGAAGPKGSDGSSGCGVCIGLCIAIMAQ
jgi:hypothetical protein